MNVFIMEKKSFGARGPFGLKTQSTHFNFVIQVLVHPPKVHPPKVIKVIAIVTLPLQ